MKLLITFVLLSLFYAPAECNEIVLLIHGLGRTKHSLSPIENFLKKNGYEVDNLEYKSTKFSIDSLCSLYIEPEINKCLQKYERVHIVTHSLGGVLIRYYLQNKKFTKIGRIVMLTPPNKGSDLSDFLKGNINFLYKLTDGPAGQELTTDSSGIASKLKPIDYEIGIIAGKKSWEPWFSMVIKGTNDGKVSVENTKLSEMKDFIIVNHTHTFIMNNTDVQDQILCFIQKGKFNSFK